jgi:transketolase
MSIIKREDKILEKIANNIRGLSIDMIDNAKSGHPGIALGASDIITNLYANHIRVNPADPNWVNRDRFVLSAGHGSSMLYSTLYIAGYDISLEDLQSFRQLDSITPGHPEYGVTPGVDVSTGPLGEGFATSVGIALGETYLRSKLGDDVINYYTYVLVGDGDLMEGVSYEAASLAGHLKLNKLIVLYDSNNITLDGGKNDSFSENIQGRFESMGWNYLNVKDPLDEEAMNNAILMAKSSDKPTIIEINTTIGKYSINQGTNKVHGSPLSKEDITSIKNTLGIRDIPFTVSLDVKEEFNTFINERIMPEYNNWNSIVQGLDENRKELLNKVINNKEPIKLSNILYEMSEDGKEATRESSGKVLNSIKDELPLLIGGSADVSGSTKALIKGSDYSVQDRSGRTIHFGVRENAMASIANGLALDGLTPFVSTFFPFSDFLKPGIRLSAMMDLPVIYVFSHDSISVGEDGPTHEAVEQLVSLRAVPNFEVYRPADANEVIGAYKTILENRKPCALVLGRNKVRIEDCTKQNDVKYGAYVLKWEQDRLDATIIATGEEVELAIDVYYRLIEHGYGIRLISMPCMERFRLQDEKYQRDLIPEFAKTFVIEAGSSYSWYKYVKNEDYLFNVNSFGASAPRSDVMNKFGLTEDKIVEKIIELLK